MPPLAPAPDLVDRFRESLAAAGVGTERLAVAVSGGPDSLALLLLAAEGLPGRVEAATVDHGLRPESAAEAEMVAGICARLGVPHAALAAEVVVERGSLQQAARKARYAALAGWMVERSLALLATAHHADDQAETLLMRLIRGSGVRGLAAIRASGPLPGHLALRVVRPLLGWRRDELAAIVEAAGLQAAADPSNADPRYDRVRLRARLAEAQWIDPEGLARSAAAIAEADEALEWTAAMLWRDRAAPTATGIRLRPGGVPPELVRRLLSRVLRELSASAEPRGEEIGRLAASLARGEVATLAGVKCTGGDVWTFAPAPPRRAR